MDWKPIETAPKDGTQVLLYWADIEPAIFVGAFAWTDIPTGNVDYWEGWLFADEILINHCDDEPEPTHWMPLPPAPPEAA